MRSGLSGAADINRDGRVSYGEIGAFVLVANAKIPNARFRPTLFMHAPRDDDKRPLLDLGRFQGTTVSVPTLQPGRYCVEDQNGVPLADLHTAPAVTVDLRLAAPSGSRVYLHDRTHAREYLLEQRPEAPALALLVPQAVRQRSKGAAHESFAKIFAQAFDPSSFRQQLFCLRSEQPQPGCYYCRSCACQDCERGGFPEAVLRQRAATREIAIAFTTGFQLLQRSMAFSGVANRQPTAFEADPRVSTGPTLVLHLELETFPMSPERFGFFSNFGVVLRYEHALAGAAGSVIGTTDYSRRSPAGLLRPGASSIQGVELGFAYRWRVMGEPHRLRWRFMFAPAWDHFNSGSQPSIMSKLDYPQLRFEPLQLDWQLFRPGRLALSALGWADYLLVFSGNEVATNLGIGEISRDSLAHGVEAGLGLRLSWSYLTLGISGLYRRDWLDFAFDPTAWVCGSGNPPCDLTTPVKVTDTQYGVTLLLGTQY